MSILKTNNLITSQKEFHKKHAKISFEEKVFEIINLQKLDMEIRGGKYKRENSYKRVWKITQ